MTSPARTPVSALPRGHEFAPARFVLTAARVRAYLDAVGDRGDYGASAPPLAAVAFGLAALQEQLSLPDGALHTGQEVEHLHPIACDAELMLTGRVAQRSERQGLVVTVIEYELADGAGPAMRARTTILAPGAAA
jgi:hypothetical protein